MKTAVSIPDSLFSAAERFAREQRISRSQLFREALEAYLKKHQADDITEQINRVCDTLDTKTPEPVKKAVYRKFAEAEW